MQPDARLSVLYLVIPLFHYSLIYLFVCFNGSYADEAQRLRPSPPSSLPPAG